MNTTDLVNAIVKFKQERAGLPSFNELTEYFGGRGFELQEEIEKAKLVGIVLEPEPNHYDVDLSMV